MEQSITVKGITLVAFFNILYECGSCFPQYKPGESAPSFMIETLRGKFVYRERKINETEDSDPILFCAFNKHSAFLRALWTEEGSVRRLLQRSPRNTQYIFLSHSENARQDVEFMQRKIYGEMEKLLSEKKDKISFHKTTASYEDEGLLDGRILFRRSTRNMKIHRHFYDEDMDEANSTELDDENVMENISSDDENDDALGHGEETIDGKHEDGELTNWKKNFHFASFPLFEFGNWIPFVMARWPCLGTSCGFPQVVFKNGKGDILQVVPRLEARYDWQPMPFRTLVRRKKTQLRYVPNPCSLRPRRINVALKGVALVSSDGKCSTFQKIQNVANLGIRFVLIYAQENQPIKEIKCEKEECFHLLGASAAMISFKDGDGARKMLENQELFVELQTTNQDNFFLAIDHRGKLAEVGLFLYPSLHFLAYEAQWFHYEADLGKKTRGHAKIVSVFNRTIMQGAKGASKEIHLPQDFLKYRNVELDMSLHCPEQYESSCPRWDHVVHLTVCCEKGNRLCGSELGRWITPYARSVGRWLTPITSLLPLFTDSTCTLTMTTVPWEMPWAPSLNIRFSDHISDSQHGYSKRRYTYSSHAIPMKITKLYTGGTFDDKYNEKYKNISFYVPDWSERVELVAIITGHGKDNNGCAEFCVTSHHFVVNDINPNVIVFKNAATAMGCAERIGSGVEPNEHGTWLYGRDGWCPGQEVVPWVKDITSQIKFKSTNTIKYFGYFNGTDPRPTNSPGNIDMTSYLVFYKKIKT